MLLKAFATLELDIANTGYPSTYAKGDKSSIVELTFVDPALMVDKLVCTVSDQYTGSDQFAILYNLQRTTTGQVNNPRYRRWASPTFDSDMFCCSLEGAVVSST